MKRAVLSIILVLACLFLQAEHHYSLYNTLKSDQDYHYIANDHIQLISGFSATPCNGHEVILEIDSYDVSPPQSGITGGSASNNDNGVVGTLEGIIDVSLLGGAIYTIPIELPLGLGGMKPQLNISYNNQSRNGLLGWAWNLDAISSITRVSSTLYHDGFASAANYTQDRFCLDGKRLLKVSSGNYGDHETSYRTEQDMLSKIICYHESEISGPSFFKIWTADGNILYYGNSDDSKALLNSQNNVNIWLLKRVEDPNGNYMEYHYHSDANTFRLSSITYSGNDRDDIKPAFTVAFQYNDRSDIEVSYIGNRLFRQNKILDGITIKKGNNLLYSYQFTYKEPNPQKGYPYHLLTEIKLSAGNEHLNPTKVYWGNNNYNIESSTDIKFHVTTNGINNAFSNAVKFSGDFNGDGYADVVATRPDSQGKYTSAEVFINKGVNGDVFFDLNNIIPLSSNISWIHVTDFNGDGLDDILLSNRTRRIFPLQDQLNADIYLSQLESSGTLSFKHYQTPTCKIPQNMIDTHLIGDFFGEGKSSVLIQSVSGNKTNNSTVITYNESDDLFLVQSFAQHLSANRFYPADYNGDGITEILFMDSNGSTCIAQLIKTTSGTYHFSQVFNGSPTQWEDCFPGDFNGDGLIDALFYKSCSTNPWTIRLSDRCGISETTYALPETFPYSSPGDYLFSLDQPNHTIQYIKVGDFDGNGCSDLGLFKDNLFYVFYGPLRTSGNDAPFANSQRISAQWFNYYDNMTMCLGNFLGNEGQAYLGAITLSHLPIMTKRHEVQKIKDGFGRMTVLQYDYLMPKLINSSNDDFYCLGETPSNPAPNIHRIAIPLRALSKITKYNTNNKPIVTTCRYEGGLLHTQGKGFLGFAKTRQDDLINGQLQKKTVRQFNILNTNGTIHLMATKENVYDKDDRLMAKSTFTNTLYCHLRNGKVFMPLTDKTLEEYDIDNPKTLLKKEIQKTTVSTHCSQNNKYNDVLSVIKQIEGVSENPNVNSANLCEFQRIINTTYFNDNTANWIINRPAIITSTLHRNGNYEDICHLKTITYYNDNPRQIRTVLDIPNNGSSLNDPLASMKTYQYDPVGNIKSIVTSTPNDTLAPRTESFEYSRTYGRRLLTKHTDALDQTESYSYDPDYDYLKTSKDCNGLVTTFEQDPFGITCSTQFPDGTKSYKAFRWNNGYYYLWEKKTGAATTVSYYNMTGNMIRQKSYDLNGETLFTDIIYDNYGRISKKNLAYKDGEAPPVMQYVYDDHNRINRIIHTDGTFETIQYNGNQQNTSLVALNGSSHTESKTYNAMGWLTKSTDARKNSVIYDYYADGKPKMFQIEGRNETRIEMTYDGLGNRISLNDPDYGLTRYKYNAFNELIQSTSPKLDKTEYSYDALGRTVMRVETDNQLNKSDTTKWYFGRVMGSRGVLTKIVSPNQTIDYEYDGFLRLNEVTENLFGSCYQTHYAYDKASRITNVVFPSNYAVNYCYTSEGCFRSVLNSESKTLFQIKEASNQMQPTAFVTGNGYVTNNTYDPNNFRLTSIHTTHGEKVVQDYSFEYDCFSNMTLRNDRKNSTAENFTYDKLNRLVGVTDETGSSHFIYDELGRMIAKTAPNGIVFTNADYTGPRPHAVKSAQASPEVFPQDRMDLVFNSFDKISSISEGTKHVSFEYGYDHQRIKTSENRLGAVRDKIYVGNCEFISTSEQGAVVRTLLSGPTGVFAVAETINDETTLYYIHKDHLGSWTFISDSTGAVKQEVQFDAWGQCNNPNHLMFDRGYTGHEHIRWLGLINMNGRLYDPITSSMLSPDNNIQMSDFTQNLNRYSYCFNNPLTYTDPDGNTVLGNAMMYYLLFCTDYGYELQKQMSPVAFHLDLHLSSQQMGIGMDASIGLPKNKPISMRFHGGATYYLNFYDNSYSGMEYRAGMEWCAFGLAGISGTSFYYGAQKQTTNAVILGNANWNVIYENDYMFHLGDHLLMGFSADGGDRYRTAAAKIRIGPYFNTGVNLFTGDPGMTWEERDRFYDPNTQSKYYDFEQGGRETYTSGIHGHNPNEYRAGVFYVGFGPVRVGENSERVRNVFQNKFAHDFLCKGDSPYFQVLDRPRQTYFYFGTGTGNTLW